MVRIEFVNYRTDETATCTGPESCQVRYGEIVDEDGEMIARRNRDDMWVFNGADYTDFVVSAEDSDDQG